MRKAFLTLAIFLFSLGTGLAMPPAWNTQAGSHFIVYYRNCDRVLVSRVLKSSEQAYRSIASRLCFQPLPAWSGNNRAKVYIYDTQEQYRTETGEPAWSDGSSIQRFRVVLSFKDAKGLLDRILVHELAHIMLRETIGFENRSVPVWLEEGFASSQEGGEILQQKRLLKDRLEKGGLIALDRLGEIDPRKLEEKSRLDLFYVQSASVVEYLISGFPAGNFPLFCRSLREGKDLESSLKAAYHFNNLKALEISWKRYLKSLSF